MREEIQVKTLENKDIEKVLKALTEPYMLQRGDYYEKYLHICLEQNKTKERVTFVAFNGEEAVGYVNVIYKSAYSYFVEKNIPEINDLYVVPQHRKKGVGKMLIDQCESFASHDYEYIGLGVGVYKGYGSAQRLYAKNGYLPDGNGLMYGNAEVEPGKTVCVDDDLLQYLIKKIR